MIKQIEILNITHEKVGGVSLSITIDGHHENILVTYSDNLERHLTIDRSDAIVMGLIYFAIKNGYNISSHVPISAELLYNLEQHFIDSLAVNEDFHRVKIDAPTIDGIEKNGEMVATGLSCGVDSLYTIMTHSKADAEKVRLTHMAFFDVGSHAVENNEEETKLIYEGRREISRKFAKEYGFPLLEIQSNIYIVIDKYEEKGYSHVEYDTYMMAFCVLLFQKGFRTYLCSSSNIYANFRTRKNIGETIGCDSYDLLTLMTASVNGLTFYSAGGSILRVDKVKTLCNYPPAWKYLNVCTNTVENCSHCPKCIRTLMAIDCFGAIDRFKDVFDVEYFKKHRQEYLRELYLDGYYNKLLIVKELFPYYSEKMTFAFKVKAHVFKYMRAIRYRLKQSLYR